MAVAHTLLVIAYLLLKRKENYRELARISLTVWT
jgi:hypothetical protein